MKEEELEGINMKSKLLALFLLAGSTMFAGARFSVGIGFGGYGPGYYAPPPPLPVVSYAAPAYPYANPGYSWVGGYYYPAGGRYLYRPGYWARPPYAGAYWNGPRYYGHRYYPGYWGRR